MIVGFIEQIPPNRLMREEITLVQEITKILMRQKQQLGGPASFCGMSFLTRLGTQTRLLIWHLRLIC